jgi:hypothetical protein
LESHSTIPDAWIANPIPLSQTPGSRIPFRHRSRLDRESHSTIAVAPIGNSIPPSQSPRLGIPFHHRSRPNVESRSTHQPAPTWKQIPTIPDPIRNRIPVCVRNPVPTQHVARIVRAVIAYADHRRSGCLGLFGVRKGVVQDHRNSFVEHYRP